MEDYYLTQEELSALFGAIHDREMAELRRQKAALEAQLNKSLAELGRHPSQGDNELDKKRQP